MSLRKRAEKAVTPLATRMAVTVVQQLVGFWLARQLAGGRQGMLDAGYSLRTVQWYEKKFRDVFAVEVDEFEFTIDDAQRIREALEGHNGAKGVFLAQQKHLVGAK